MKLIPLDALVAEIEELKLCTMDEHMNYYSAEAHGEYNALSKLESFIDTLEVKEVDLDKPFEGIKVQTSMESGSLDEVIVTTKYKALKGEKV